MRFTTPAAYAFLNPIRLFAASSPGKPVAADSSRRRREPKPEIVAADAFEVTPFGRRRKRARSARRVRALALSAAIGSIAGLLWYLM